MADLVRLVLPIEAEARAAGVVAPGLVAFDGVRLGVVDNGLWRAMRVFARWWEEQTAALGATSVEVVPFDHLAADFADQQRALGPFGKRVDGVVTGLGN